MALLAQNHLSPPSGTAIIDNSIFAWISFNGFVKEYIVVGHNVPELRPTQFPSRPHDGQFDAEFIFTHL